jgi:RHS repeat-associated protein
LREDYRFTGKEEDIEVGLQYFGKRYLSPYLNRWVSADPLAVHVPGKADPNLYAYVHGQVIHSADPVGLDDEPTSVKTSFEPTQDNKETNTVYTFSDATIHAKSPSPAVSDQDKIADSLGVPRAEIQNGAPTGQTLDRARMALPSAMQKNSTLQPVADSNGIQAWTTENVGVKRLQDLTGDEVGYAGEKPAVPVVSPIDVAGPAMVRGIWMLGGRTLQLGNAAASGGPKLLPAPTESNPWLAGAELRSATVGQEGMTMYRIHGPGRATGAWGTSNPYVSQSEARSALALRPEWNQASHISEIQLAPGTQVQIGTAAPQGALPGGGMQMRVLNKSDIARQTVVGTRGLPE